MSEHRLVIPAPGPWLNANQRLHWSQRAVVTALWRDTARWRAREAKLPKLERARIVAVLRFGDARRRDPANWAPTIKACVDALVDERVLPDDDDKHLIGPDLRLGEKVPAGLFRPNGRVELVITDLGGSDA